MNDTDPNIFKYALVADMGVEVDQPTVPLTIAGNVYAASDYYNKQYNESTWDEDVSDDSKKLTTSDTYEIEQEDGENVNIAELYQHGSVTSKSAKERKLQVHIPIIIIMQHRTIKRRLQEETIIMMVQQLRVNTQDSM